MKNNNKYICKCLAICKQFRVALKSSRNIYNSIAIVFALNLIYNNIESSKSTLLDTKDKTISNIPQIFYFAKLKNVDKKGTGITNNLGMLFHGLLLR